MQVGITAIRAALDSIGRSPAITYALVLTVWALVFGTFGVLLVDGELTQAQRRFDALVDTLDRQLSTRLQANEAVLAGMAAFLEVAGTDNPSQNRAYVSQILNRYRRIYQVQIQQRVSNEQRESFVAEMRRRAYPNYRIRTYSFETRQWQPLADKAFYFPVRFVAPQRPGDGSMLGLDLSSVPFLASALQASLNEREVIASRPFELLEGGRGYVLFAPIGSLRQQSVSVVVRAEDLLNYAWVRQLGRRVVVEHTGFADGEPARVIDYGSNAPQSWDQQLFGKLTAERRFQSIAQPFLLRVEQQLSLRWLSGDVLLGYGVIVLGTLVPVLLLTRGHIRRRREQSQVQAQLYRLANYDSLTGLPNRHLFADRVEGALARSRRSDGRFALLYVDLDGFKTVNDTAGHATGDHVLLQAGRRLRSSVREEDTVARLSGDEFAVLLEGAWDKSSAERVVRDLRTAFEVPFYVAWHRFHVTASIGVAVYPEDGEDLDSLLSVSDSAMYRDKRHRR